jgi:mono/diheme cytochrome c family protein
VKIIGKRVVWVKGAICVLSVSATLLVATATRESKAGPLLSRLGLGHGRASGCCDEAGPLTNDLGATWYWLRSPEEEKRVTAGLYNRYCIRCHGVDGRGVWDIPGVPDFTSARWQAFRSDAQRARIILEGRGAVMPPFRGALSLEEAWAIGRYLHTFEPGTEVSRPDLTAPKLPADAPAPRKAEPPAK